MGYDLRQFTIEEVGKRTANLARVRNNDDLGTSPDDEPTLLSFFDDAVLRIATMCNLVKNVAPTETGAPDIPLEVIPRRMWTAITLFVMKEWFKSIGEIDLGNFYENEFDKESSKYRFSPDNPAFAKRPYRAI